MDQIITNDIFRAAYHLGNEIHSFEVKLNSDSKKQFVIKGESLNNADLQYCLGQALINPLTFEKSYQYLMEVEPGRLSLSNILKQDCLGEIILTETQ